MKLNSNIVKKEEKVWCKNLECIRNGLWVFNLG